MRSVNCEWVLVCFFMIVACAGRAQGGDLLGISPADTLDAGDSRPKELALPKVPTTLREPVDRANYIVTHFWDDMNFRDTLFSHSTDFIEQNFANFISLFPHAEEHVRRAAVNQLLNAAVVDSAAYVLLANTAEKYLYELNSPMFSEDYYLLFLERMVDSPLLNTIRLHYQLEAVRKNCPGMTAANFSYVTRDGKRCSLRDTKVGGQLLLIFYDPDCDHCKDVMADLKTNGTLSAAIVSGRVTALAIYSGEDREQWQETASLLPERWIVGFDTSDLEEKGLYVLRALPTLYLLDSEKKVILKDVSPVYLFDWLKQEQ